MCYRCKCAAKVVLFFESTKFEKQIFLFLGQISPMRLIGRMRRIGVIGEKAPPRPSPKGKGDKVRD